MPHPAPHRFTIAFVLTLTLSVAEAQIVTPEVALALPAGALAAEEAALSEALAALTGLGFDASLRAVVRAERDVEPGGAAQAWDGDANVVGTVGYRHDPIARLRAERAVERARRDLRDAERAAVLRAFRAHADWWAAERTIAPLGEARGEASAALAAGRANPGSVDAWTLAELELAFARADLAWREAHAEVARAAEAFPSGGTPGYAPLRFALEEPDVGELFGVRARASLLAEARAALTQAGTFAVIDDALVTLDLAGDGVAFGAEGGVTNGRLGASASLGVAGGTRARGSVGVRLEVVLRHDTAWRVAQARAAVEDTEADLLAFLALLPDAIAAARARVAFAEEGLALAERTLALEVERGDALRRQLAGGADGEGRDLRRDLERSDTARARATNALQSAWLGYVRAVDALLAITERPWQLR